MQININFKINDDKFIIEEQHIINDSYFFRNKFFIYNFNNYINDPQDLIKKISKNKDIVIYQYNYMPIDNMLNNNNTHNNNIHELILKIYSLDDNIYLEYGFLYEYMYFSEIKKNTGLHYKPDENIITRELKNYEYNKILLTDKIKQKLINCLQEYYNK